MSRKNFVFTSESVSEGHPDKVCDRISDEIVDLFYREALEQGFDPWAVRVACETLATTNYVVIAGETRGPASVTKEKIEAAARKAIKDIGYEQSGFHWETAKIVILLHSQSADIAQGVDAAREEGRGRGRPGHHVRLCLRRDAGTDAGAALLLPQDPEAAGRRPPLRQGKGAGPRCQEPGQRHLQERQAGRRQPDRGVAPAYRREPHLRRTC